MNLLTDYAKMKVLDANGCCQFCKPHRIGLEPKAGDCGCAWSLSLYLSLNQLDGSLPAEFGNLRSIQIMKWVSCRTLCPCKLTMKFLSNLWL
ncbi:uncharacterized protein G2W53_033281 [Senna tora]|uniref:Uncharacterized protein n=1 Tax=Senna tora TaxID=362788 RepID=A0A834SXY4_9FABA|nr:uncharacterized protein G2W53_033281 [Senna tora]